MSGETDTTWTGGVPVAATAVVKRIEQFSATPYDDNGGGPGGTTTIGYGTIVDANGHRVTASTPPVTEAQAEALLTRDMAGSAAAVKHRVSVALLEHEAAALISWTYNLGDGNLRTSTLLKRLNANDKAAVPAEMRKWIMDEGAPSLGLLRRRWAEAAIFKDVDPARACDRAWSEITALGQWPNFA